MTCKKAPLGAECRRCHKVGMQHTEEECRVAKLTYPLINRLAHDPKNTDLRSKIEAIIGRKLPEDFCVKKSTDTNS